MVINKLNVTPIDFFFRIFFLFHFEDMLHASQLAHSKGGYKLYAKGVCEPRKQLPNLIEMLLQFLVCKVDTELLKTMDI